MKSLVEFIKESLDAQINESASVEALLMFLNRWDGECVKICDLPAGTDGNKFAKELADEFDSENTVIEYCDDCKCIIIKSKDCENCDDCKEIKYAELFKESKNEEDAPKELDVVKDYNDDKWVVIKAFDVNNSSQSDYEAFLKEWDGTGSQKSEMPNISDVKDADTIIVLDKGEIIQKGKHEDLINEKGLYANFYFQQSSRELEVLE